MVTSYEVIGDPPFDAGAWYATRRAPLDIGVTAEIVGASG
jgi:hypothetical protein